MSVTDAGRIRYLSPPARVSMGEEWYDLAVLDHFWIQRRFEVLRRIAGGLIQQSSCTAEVGCGHGTLQRQIEDYFGKEVTGFDLNELALKQSVSRISPLCCYNLLDRNPEYRNRFDLILLFDVLEHVADEDSFIEAIRLHLSPSGKILINVPAIQSLWSQYDRAAGHFRRYDIDALSSVAKRNGMAIGGWSYWGLPLTPLLVLRKFWIAGKSDEEILSSGFSSRGAATNRLLLALSRCEVIPQRFFGSSLMATFENPH